jgi:DNA-directed RNA polymerase specialized sigma24 family protein
MGLSEEEIAQLLGVSVKTIKNDWRYAKAKLKQAMV